MAFRGSKTPPPIVSRFFTMRRLAELAAELGTTADKLAAMPADEVEDLITVSDTFHAWRAEQIDDE